MEKFLNSYKNNVNKCIAILSVTEKHSVIAKFSYNFLMG